jgi:hypothetical protein
LPIFAGMTEVEQDEVVAAVRSLWGAFGG